jgi:hypothetical protein
MNRCIAVVLALASSSLLAQTPAVTASAAAGAKPALVTYQFDRPGLPVPHFTMEIDAAGHGRYQADEVQSLPAKFAQYAGTATQKTETKHIDRTLEVSPATVDLIFKTAHTLNMFNVVCASKMKNIADTGKKTLTYTGPDGTGSCTYNYSENKNVDVMTTTFYNIAFTLDEGRKLDFDHRYDRLGLDEEMTFLVKAVDDKRALEINAISEALNSIINDTAILQRVRTQAARLMEDAKQTTEAAN